MATQTDIPTWLTNSDLAYLTHIFDSGLNSRLLFSQLLGIYTGIFAVTMWNAVGYTSHGQNMWMRYLSLTGDYTALGSVGEGTAGIICNILADSTMIWHCWMVWGQHYSIVVLPSLCLFASTATTIWCTLLIVYRILSVGWANSGAEGRLGAYWHVIEVLVESSALYSICLIIYVVCYASNNWGGYYADILASISRGIAPTLLIGRVATGHALPDDSWNGSIMSSLHFGQDQSQTSPQQDSMFSISLNDNPETQVEQTDEPDSEYVHQTSSQRMRVSRNDVEAQLEEVEIGHEATPRPIVQG
ncbi:hypothetical protein ARMGADRAFT_1030289 [Armillaria gallica]|uniref:Uncharacterized protein n=1 Tax=Armillaria gallica TaxID=47427 RepID=A0A2H3DHY6_ARMGA|nr:hypothetical protein ARMGADRAFT_1030289 [Armillaria gallica]